MNQLIHHKGITSVHAVAQREREGPAPEEAWEGEGLRGQPDRG